MTGWADMEGGVPVTEDTIFQMYSMTKPITCTAALILYERGKFLLEEPVSDYLPEFKEMHVKTENGIVPCKNPVRIIDLFTMSSGLNYDFQSPALAKLYDSKPNFTARDAVKALASEPLEFEPGEHYLYSFSHDVLGVLIEEISGKTLGKFFRDEIFDPLHMDSASFRLTEKMLPHFARTYPFVKGEPPKKALPIKSSPLFISDTFESGGGGLMMTVNDYMKFADCMTNRGKCPKTGARLLSGGMVDAMRENQLDENRLKSFRSTPARYGYGYGLGVRTLMSKGQSGSAGAAGEFGWGGMCGTYLLMDPQNRLSIVYAMAASPSPNTEIQRRLRNIVYRAIEE